jgi:predicted kinase
VRFEQAEEWIEDHFLRRRTQEFRWVPYNHDNVIMLIGPPGAGKSTYRQKLLDQHDDAVVISMDDLRVEWYGGPYDQAFAKASKDSSFNAKVDQVYIDALRNHKTVILDNTNTSGKARKRWIAPARARDFRLTAVLFPSTLQQVLDRQRTRDDKTIPDKVVRDMYNRLSLPLYGDFDTITVVDSNLPA